MKLITAIIGLITGVLIVFPTPAHAYEVVESGTHAAPFEIKTDGVKLTVDADSVPLQDLLRRLSGYGVKIAVDPSINPLITASFNDRDIQDGLKSILKSINYVLIWRQVEGPFRKFDRIAEIQVFEWGKRNRIKPLQKSTVLDLARNLEDGSYYVRGEFLLSVDPRIPREILERRLEEIGARVLEGNRNLGVYRISAPEDADIPDLAARINRSMGGRYAEPNYAYPIVDPYRTAGESSNEPAGGVYTPKENEVPVAVMDTGLLPGSELESFVVASLDALNPRNALENDTLGHGTQMAYIASGTIDPMGMEQDNQNPIIPIRAFDDNGVTSNFAVMNSIDFAVENGAGVMSLSWGSETRSEFLEKALDYASSKGLIIVGSAGNEPTGTPFFPAAYSTVIGVGASAPDGSRWEKSNHGAFVDLYAPGFADFPVGYKGDAGTYAGTSIAAACTANRIARYLAEHPNASREAVLKHIKE